MSEPSGNGSALAYSRQSLEQLAATLARPLAASESFDKVFYPECNAAELAQDGLYPYQCVARDLLRGSENLNLLVASPTGSGKTRVIEECVALARAKRQRIFVAEPLIALVEQIYARLGGDNICMLTGPSRKGLEGADVVVCTYEVLARLAACEPQRLDGCPRIVLDEFHFLGTDRGPVIEEILAHCQPGRSVVALSGTMPNTAQLAAFLARINGFPTYVVGAAQRPIQISFYAYAAAEDRMSALALPQRPQPFRSQAFGGVHDRQALLRLLAQLDDWDCHPSLLVSFSCRRLDEMANWAASVSNIDRGARSLVAIGFGKLLKGVPPEDRGLFALYRHWANHGVAVHHSHAPVPYLELVSWLAEKRALRLVFSSSTLSAGINLPVRTMCLLSARVPKKNAAGDMEHVDIDPLLFHQLVGRAGRPGYETVGNCILAVRRSSDYGSAQALMCCTVPPVLPAGGFTPGDVLRAARDRRNLLVEVQALACPLEHALALRSLRAARICDTALERVPPDAAAAIRRRVRAVLQVLKAPPALLPFALIVAPEPKALLLGDAGHFAVAAPEAAEPHLRVVPLTTTKRSPTKIPFEDFQAVLELQEAFKALLAPVDETAEPLARICFLSQEALDYLETSPLHEDFQRAARPLEGACLQRQGQGYAVTALGLAACEIRTVDDPAEVLQRLLGLGRLDAWQALAFASQALREGGRSSEMEVDGEAPLAAKLQQAEAVLGSLPSVPNGTSREWTLAVLCWALGSSLEELQPLLPVGSFCRHIMRVADLCEELSSAAMALAVDASAFEEAASSVKRGMPFAKRGAWKQQAEPEVLESLEDDMDD
jgi:hypothetical protein